MTHSQPQMSPEDHHIVNRAAAEALAQIMATMAIKPDEFPQRPAAAVMWMLVDMYASVSPTAERFRENMDGFVEDFRENMEILMAQNYENTAEIARNRMGMVLKNAALVMLAAKAADIITAKPGDAEGAPIDRIVELLNGAPDAAETALGELVEQAKVGCNCPACRARRQAEAEAAVKH
jgi:hypothetical protein